MHKPHGIALRPERFGRGKEDRQHFDCATWLHKAREMAKEKFKREVDKELTGREAVPPPLNINLGRGYRSFAKQSQEVLCFQSTLKTREVAILH